MALFRVLCWALIFILKLRFPPGSSLTIKLIHAVNSIGEETLNLFCWFNRVRFGLTESKPKLRLTGDDSDSRSRFGDLTTTQVDNFCTGSNFSKPFYVYSLWSIVLLLLIYVFRTLSLFIRISYFPLLQHCVQTSALFNQIWNVNWFKSLVAARKIAIF